MDQQTLSAVGNLQNESLLYRVTQVLSSELSVQDRDASEFVVALGRSSSTSSALHEALSAQGVLLDEGLASKIYTLCHDFDPRHILAALASTRAALPFPPEPPPDESEWLCSVRESIWSWDILDPASRILTTRSADHHRAGDRVAEAPQPSARSTSEPAPEDPFESSQLNRWRPMRELPAPAAQVEHAISIERREHTPAFLRARASLRAATALSSSSLDPTPVLKNPQGSLHWASTRPQSALSRDIREQRESQRQAAVERANLAMLGSRGDNDIVGLEDPMKGDATLGGGASGAQDPPMLHVGQTLMDQLAATEPAAPSIPAWKRIAMASLLASTTGPSDEAAESISAQRARLPIAAFRETLLEAITAHSILILVGETGSGKTTQLAQYLYETGYAASGRRIGCTQPRRVAATSVAARVAEEIGCVLGDRVGYSIRFEDMTTPGTAIKYMTDGMLLRECLLDARLDQYRVVILDEAHERSIHTDVLMAWLKRAVAARASQNPPLHLIVTSATLDAARFSAYFCNAPVFTIPGRTHPVDILWALEPEPDYLDAALVTVLQIHIESPPGDILVFLTGQEEIDTACQVLYERTQRLGPQLAPLIVLPIYAALPAELQRRIFEPAPPGARKVILGTNIAETSVTIDGIRYVVDPGFVKQKLYNPRTGMDALVVVPVSRAQATQRTGRAGRTGPGRCYRLYTEAAFMREMAEAPLPEIQRANLANTVLTMKALGVADVFHFDLMDPPAEDQLVAAMRTLYALGAVDDDGLLTRTGRAMAEFPLEPQLAKVLLASVGMRCADQVLTIVAMLSAGNVFYRPRDRATAADKRRQQLAHPRGDHLTLLNIYQSWVTADRAAGWCFENYVQFRSLKRADEVRKQLLTLCDRHKLDVVPAERGGGDETSVQRAITAGFFQHAARRDPQDGGYKTAVDGTTVYMHPSSALFHRAPEWVVYHELIQTTREYMREVTAIEPAWLPELAPKVYARVDPEELTRGKRRERLQPLHDPWRDPHAWRISKRKG